mgnify:FL=1
MKTRLISILLVLTALGSNPASANDLEFEAESPAQVQEPIKSPGTATGLAVGGLLVPAAFMTYLATSDGSGGGAGAGAAIFMFGGTIFGPGLGHAYAGDSGRFWKGAGLRTLAWGGFIGALAASWDNPDASGAGAIAVGSMALYLVSAVSDIVTADDSVRRYNERVEASRVSLRPTWQPQDEAVGLQVAVRF